MSAEAISRLNAALGGRYRVEDQLGAGGMATVYLARDQKHNRHVALKVLRPELAAIVGAERFLAEIETTANLQHPNILPLFDSGEADGFLFYVMPYVEGESLRARLDRERQLPVNDAVRIATDVAEALDHAHHRGVIHRDIKPANVLLQDGKPIVADFGIALALSSAGGSRLTETGLSLGTPHYMSPEQATGEAVVGPPTDVWALGCILHEMLVGEPPYTGGTPQAILGRIITGETPSARAERTSVPLNVDAVIGRALEKVPADRFGSADGFAKALADPAFRHGHVAAGTAPNAPRRPLLGWFLAALTGLALGVVITRATLGVPSPPRPVYGSITLPGDTVLSRVAISAIDMSPDGTTLVYNLTDEAGERRLYLRRLDSGFEMQVLAGSEGAASVIFAPDGQSVIYGVGSEVRRAPVDGGPFRTICSTDCRGMSFGTLTAGDTLIFTRETQGLVAVPASGGPATPLTTLDEAAGEVDHVWPRALPQGGILYGVEFSTGDAELRLLSRGESRVVMTGINQGRYANGWLLYPVGSSIQAIRFDPADGTTSGDPVEIVDDLEGRSSVSLAFFVVGDEGTLTYVPSSTSPFERAVLRVDREGEGTVVSTEAREFAFPRLSPTDSTLLLFTHRGDIWTLDLASKIERRLTAGGGNSNAVWAPGNRVLYVSDRDGVPSIFVKSADEREDGRPFLTSEHQQWTDAVTPDGRSFIFSQRAPGGAAGDIWTVPFPEGADPTLLLGDEANTFPGGISPDGRWLVYVSDRNGAFEVYVTDFPNLSEHRRVSVDGGHEPVWSPRGDELFYRDGDRMMVVAYRTGEDGTFDPEPARELFERRYYNCCPGLASYAVAADGRSLFMLQGGEPREIRFLRGWDAVGAARAGR